MTPAPRIEGIKKIAETFRKVAKEHGGNDGSEVDMSVTSINQTECGTCACHAGWYALATTEHEWDGSYAHFKDEKGGWAPAITYGYGADRMAEAAGYESRYKLEEWAHENPEMWGNGYGGGMFSDSRAFGYFEYDEGGDEEGGGRPEGDGTPQSASFHIGAIADHWEGVYERLCEKARQKRTDDRTQPREG